MNFLELTQSRRSIRDFKQIDVSQEDITKLLQAAQSAPSAGNCQPWRFFVIRDKTIRAEITAAAGQQPFILSAPVMLAVCADIQRSEAQYGDRGRTLYCIQDTAAAIQNILLCAKDLGLGTCWCGAFDEDAVSAILHLPKDLRPVAIIPVGYPTNETIFRNNRRPLNEIVTYIGDDDDFTQEENKWDDNEDVQRKVEHCDLSGTVFHDVNLGGSSFTDINFYGVEITDANLSDGKIHDCNLSNLAIFDCKLDGMTINGKDIGNLCQN